LKKLTNFIIIGCISLLSFVPFSAFSQCTLNLIASTDSVICGECVTLSAYGTMDGNIAFQEDFNSGSPVGWQFTQAVTIANNTCGVPAPDGSDFMWMGDQSVNPRDMTTIGFDLTNGGTVCFEMRYSEQGDASPCEGPDEPDEGVYLQYSTNNGATWINIDYWDPNGGNDPNLINWNQYCVSIPPGAMTSNTMIQWHQDAVSGAEYDHWGIDNVQITLNDPTSQITWLHDGFSYPVGSGGGENPTPICFKNDSTFTAQITNGTNTCTETITIGVKNPVVTVSAAPDTSICPGECVQIVGESKVVTSPASTPTFENNEFSVVASGSADMNINVTGLNQTTLTSTSITEVCLTGFTFSGTQICTSLGGCNCNGTTIAIGQTCNLDISSFDVILTTPNGCQITLVPNGVASGTDYTNVCFVPSGGANINGGGFPAPGTWNPDQPLTDLNGCDANGVWNLEVNAPGGLGFGIGTLQGWSISFDDPEISYPADFSWNPTTGLSDTTTLSPTACPTGNTTYTITATDSNNCVVATDDVTINMNSSCCNFDIDATATNSNCDNNDGSIDITVTNGSGTYGYDWGNGITSEDLTNIGGGTYTVTITDSVQGCSRDTTISIVDTNQFTITAVINQPTCANNDGGIFITPSPSGSYTYNWTPNVSSLDSATNLVPGSYQIQISNGICSVDTTILLNTPTGCGNCLDPLVLSIDSTDNTKCGGASGCTYSGPSILINEINLVPTTNDGSIYGQTGTPGNEEGEWIELYNPDWCNPVDISGYVLGSFNSSGNIFFTPYASNGMGFILPPGTVVPPLGFVIVRGRNAPTPPATAIDIIVDDLSGNLCIDGGINDSRIWFQNTGGWFGFYDATGVPQDIVQWGTPTASDLNGTPCIPSSSPIGSLASANASGITTNLGTTPTTGQTYVRIPDGSNWSTTTQSENSSYGTCNDLVGGCVIAAGGTSSCNGTATVTVVSGAAGPYTYQWNDPLNQTTATADSLCPGNYCVTVTDSSGDCIETICVEVLDDSRITFTTQVTQPDCSNSNGEIILTPDSVGNYTYTWTPNVSSSSTASSLTSGTYDVQVTNGICSWDTTITLTAPTPFSISTVVNQPTCGNSDGSITINPSPTGSYTYTWSPNISSTNSASSLGFGSYQIVISDGFCTIDTTIILSSPNQPVITTVNVVEPACGNNNGEIEIIMTGGVNPITYSIDNGSNSQSSNTFTALGDGYYLIVVTDSNGCIDTASVTLTNIGGPIITDVTVNDENCTASDGEIIITATGTGTLSYSIDDGTTNQFNNTFSGLAQGSYDIVVTDDNCSTSQTVSLDQINNLAALFIADPTSGMAPLDVNFTNQSTGIIDSIYWDFGDGNNSLINNPSNTFVEYGTYSPTLYIYNDQGCQDSYSISILVDDVYSILIPNVFTPNGDASNDVFTIKTKFIDELNVKIFNRWGKEMYQITEPGGFWDGGDASDGTYFFILNATSTNGETIEKTGTISLIR
jgi:gliding motility-associated-like protein